MITLSCSTACFLKKSPETIKVVEVPVACLLDPKPETPYIEFDTCTGLEGEQWEICLDQFNANKLVRYILEIRGWVDQAWIACGPK